MKRIKIDGVWFLKSEDGETLTKDEDQAETPETPEGDKPEGDKPEGEKPEGGEGEDTASEVEAANKAASLVMEKIAEYQRVQNEILEKKAKVNGGMHIQSVDPDIKLYETRKGQAVMIKESSVEMTAKWLRYLISWKLQGNPQAYQDMQVLGKKMDAHAKALGMSVKLNVQDSATATEGGNLIPVILHNAIVPLIEDMAVIRPNATVLDMTGVKTLDIPTIMGKPIMTINGENVAKGTSSMDFGKFTLTPYNLAAIVVLTTDLIDFAAFDLVKLLTQAFAEATAKAEDKLFMTGDGSSKPTGIDNYTFAKTINAGGNVTFKHLLQAYFGVGQAHRTVGSWIMDNESLIAVSGMVDSQGRPILDMGTLATTGFPNIKGRPVYEQNDINNKIFFGNLKAYWIGASRALRIDVSKESTIRSTNLWEKNLMAVRAEEKIDGELSDQRAFAEINNV